MTIIHRAISTWFIILVFLILVCLRLESKTHWNWFIVFIPMWAYDCILVMYVLFQVVSQCKGGAERVRLAVRKNLSHAGAVALKMAAQILICVRLEYPKAGLPIYAVMCPVWLLLGATSVDVFFKLIDRNRGTY